MDNLEFDNISSAAIWIACIALSVIGMTYIESTHSLARGILAGGAAIVIMLGVGWVARRNIR